MTVGMRLPRLAAAVTLLCVPCLALAEEKLPDLAALKKLNARLAPVDLKADISKLPQSELSALAKIIEAAQLMDSLFLRQVWAGNEARLLELLGDRTPLGNEQLKAFVLQGGPWDRIDELKPFLARVPAVK